MTKKINPQLLTDLLEEIMSKMTLEEQEIAIQLFSGGPEKFNEELSDMYYHFQCPDYSLMIQPIASYLTPLWEMIVGDEILLSDLFDICAAVPGKELERDLRNFVFNIIVASKDPDDDYCEYRIWYIFALMEHFRIERCLDVILEILRQDIRFYNLHFGFMHGTLPATIVYQLGRNQLPVLMDFMKEPGLLLVAKYRVVEAVANMMLANPSARPEVMKWFCKLLNYYFPLMEDENNDICPLLLLDHITACMMDTRGMEALPILEKIYRTYNITSFGVEDISELKEKMSSTELNGLEVESVVDYINEYLRDLNDIPFDFSPLYLDIEPAKKLLLKIILEDSDPLIWRTLEVPSNICLERFSEVIETAMGWEGYHLHQFKKGRVYYLPEGDMDESSVFGRPTIEFADSYSLSLGELLTRKGMSVEYEYDFGDGWMHKIILESRQAYKKGEIPVIALLDGAGACPPEDCGGVYGYQQILKALEKPRSKAAREYREWLGHDFDPNVFDIEQQRSELEEIEE